ncbi:MAG: hypothetical protein KF789_08510 [Bdellovibrionaceae bacterium]|nr:hypothetical protein [Pseudobdellovibrionaceae bacterium]
MAVTMSQFRQGKIALGEESTTPPVLARVSINDSTGAVTYGTGDDVALTNVAGSSVTGAFIASKVWNAVWNDVADFQQLDDELVFGKCYYDTASGAKICTAPCQMAVIGIASDTFGSALGNGNHEKQVPIAVAGWALAYVDKEYPTGTPLTNDEHGNLTEIHLEDKKNFPERIVAVYKKKEAAEFFGPEGAKIKVNGRHWVKIK